MMNFKSTFQSIIALHQEEFPFDLCERKTKLPVKSERIVTVTGIRRCGKSSLLGQCDFVIQRGDEVSELVQVCWELNDKNMKREVDGLLAATEFINCKKCKIITYNQTDALHYEGIDIEVVPVYRV